MMLLKITGAGYKIEISVEDDATVMDIKNAVENETGLHPSYQRLLWRGKELKQHDDDTGSCASVYGVCHRTKLMLLHSAAYVQDKDQMMKLQRILEEMNTMEQKASTNTLTPSEVQHCCTLLCCQLDGIDVGSSDTLRQIRRKHIQRCHEIANLYPETK